MSLEIYAEPNDTKNGFRIPNEYNRARFLDWLKKYKSFKITPVVEESRVSRGYLNGAVVPSYCHWQYGIDPRELGKSDQRAYLFRRDFNGEVVTNRAGEPERIPTSLLGKTREVLDSYTRWAEENGAPIPNPDLYKKWRDEFSMNPRWAHYWDWLEALGVGDDAMPSAETIEAFRTSNNN